MDDPTDWKSVRQGLTWLVGTPGWLRKLGKSYLAYYKRDFHPSKRDSAHLRQQGLEKLARLMKRPQLLS